MEHEVVRLDMVLPHDSNASGLARHATSRFLTDRCSIRLLEDVLIVISELVTNAVVHTGDGCALAVHHRGETILVEVHDKDSAPKPKPDNDFTELGRGLGVVQSLTERWGIERLTNGKCVWAEFAVAQS